MIRAILRLVEWLDRRYPPRVMVTQEKYDELEEKLRRRARESADMMAEARGLSERLTAMEQAVAAAVEREGEQAMERLQSASRIEQMSARIKAVEDAAAGIKDFLAKNGTAIVAAEKRRAEFIASGRITE